MKKLTDSQIDVLLSLRDDGPIVGDACALVRFGRMRRVMLRGLEWRGLVRHFPTSDSWRITSIGKNALKDWETATAKASARARGDAIVTLLAAEKKRHKSQRLAMRFTDLKQMLPRQCDKLPQPVEFRSGKIRARKRWVGFGWVDEGVADGSEPLLVIE